MTNHPNRSKKKIRQTRAELQRVFDALAGMNARCMEQLQDSENGILCERWVTPNGKTLIVYGTPLWRDVYQVVAETNTWLATINGIRAIAGLEPLAALEETDEADAVTT